MRRLLLDHIGSGTGPVGPALAGPILGTVPHDEQFQAGMQFVT